jgi:hexosaminidase
MLLMHCFNFTCLNFSDVENAITPMMWEKYARIFKSVWIGSAFKGANKPNSVIVNETLYLNNHLSWLRVMTDYNDLLKFKGIMLTGWQRYDHFSVLCELLPSAIPSLAACMKFMNSSYVPHVESILQNVSTSLNCGNYLNYCNFPGSTIHQEINQLEYYKVFKFNYLQYFQET